MNDKVLKHDLDIDAIVEAMETAEVVEDFEGGHKKTLYIGTVFGLTPSGKYYMPWACSNVDPCDVCGGKGEVNNPRHLPKLYSRANELVQELVQTWIKTSIYNDWPEEIRNRVDWLRAVCDRTKPLLTCPRCDGIGSAEACDDEVWRDTLEDDLSEHGLYLESGEGDPCDLFVSMVVEEEDGEVEEESEMCYGRSG